MCMSKVVFGRSLRYAAQLRHKRMFGNMYAPNVGVIFLDTYHATSSSSLAHISRLSIHEPTILLSALINKPAFEQCHRKYSIRPTQAGDMHNAFLALITIFFWFYTMRAFWAIYSRAYVPGGHSALGENVLLKTHYNSIRSAIAISFHIY